VFINQYFRGVSPEVIAERLGTNRNNVYKIAHDARVKLKKHLAAQGLTEDEILAAFQDHTATALVSDGLAL
jgi:RNA polymerase sigma-70 factor (ECF subfamily)